MLNEKVFESADTLAFDGGAVKALGNGKIAGYGILFTSVKDPDLQQEFFTKDTNLMLDVGDQRPLLYRHGMHPSIKTQRGGSAKLVRVDEVGAFFESELDVSNKYWKQVYRLAEEGRLGYSTGSMTHLVEKELREEGGKKAMGLITWPVGELSVTPMPVEPRTAAFPVKSLLKEEDFDFDLAIKSAEQEEHDQQFEIEGTPSIKRFCEAVAPMSLKDSTHRSESAANAAKEFITITSILGEAYDSYTSRLVKRTENRFLKEGRELDPSTVTQVENSITDIEKIETAIQSVKDSLLGIRKITELTVAERKAMDERARLAMWNFCRISGTEPEELEDARSTG